MKHQNTRRGNTQEDKKAVICPPCREQSLASEGFYPGAAQAAKEGQNRKKALCPLLPCLTAVLPPQGRGMNRGFTLIELLVVVLIIAILAAVALPQYNKAVKKAYGAEALVALEALDKALTAYYLENGSYTGVTVDTLSIEIPESQHIRYSVGCYTPYTQTSANLHDSKIHTSDASAHTYMRFPEEELFIRLFAYENKNSINCQRIPMATSSVSCADYFNCNAAPITYVPAAQSGTVTIPAHYEGGECKLL